MAATDPNKKRPDGAQIGNLTLVPGSGADAAVKAVQGFKADYNAAPTAPKIISPDNPLSMSTFTPPSAGVSAPSPAAIPSPIGSAQAAPAPKPTLNLIEAGNPDSLKITPPSAGFSARNPASSAPSAGAAAPAGGVAAPSPGGQVLGTFNGRQITQADSDRLSAALPTASGPVVMGPNGSFAASTTPLSAPAAAQAPQQIAAPAARTTIDTFAQRDAAKARDAELGRLNSVISRMEFGPGALNNPGERQLYAQLVAQRNGLIQQQGTLAGSDINSQRDAATSLDVSSATQAGANARTAADNAGAMDRTVLQEAGATGRAMIQPPEYKQDENGNLVQVSGTSATPVTADGQPLKVPVTKAQGGLQPADVVNAYNEQLKAIAAGTPFGQQPDLTALNASPLGQSFARLFAGNSGGAEAPSATTATNPKTGERLRLNPQTGKWEPMK